MDNLVVRRITCHQCNRKVFLEIPSALQDEIYYYLENDLLQDNGSAETDLPCPVCGGETTYTVIELLYFLGEVEIRHNEIKEKEKFLKEY